MSKVPAIVTALVSLGLIGTGLWWINPPLALVGTGLLIWIDLSWSTRREHIRKHIRD